MRWGFEVTHVGGDIYRLSLDNNENTTLEILIKERDLVNLSKEIEVLIYDKMVEEYGLD